ncbi:uL30 family ribosomal protein [Candidatus Woesearchaeota archaeon]|nr:uL30 family ribosomal protein [Candidatus Woesearchaeota archaeon]
MAVTPNSKIVHSSPHSSGKTSSNGGFQKRSTAASSQKVSAKGISGSSNGTKLAVVLVRGMIDLNTPLRDTLSSLRLHHKNHCVVVGDSPVSRGMIQKVKDYVTWGEISPAVYQELVEKRGKEFKARLTDGKKKYAYAFIEFQGKKYKPYFALNPPRKGFGRKGIKVAFRAGGALGFRGEKINDLLQRMM